MSPFMQKYPPGHYYSPVPSLSDALSHNETVYSKRLNKNCPGVSLQEAKQLELLDRFISLSSEFNLPLLENVDFRYYGENGYFPIGDAIILYGMMLHYRPRNVIEVGSGFSSAAMLDVNDLFLNDSVEFHFVEPRPQRLYSALGLDDRSRYEITVSNVQDVDVNLFKSLNANDVLFIDSSHVIKVGSDVEYLLFDVLPILDKGVIVHFHDIPWPFEYPKEYYQSGRAWNEVYAIRAFLQFNKVFKIIFYNSFVKTFFSEKIKAKMPIFADHPSSSLWLRREE